MPTIAPNRYEGVARNRRCNDLWTSAVAAIRGYAEQTGHTYPPLRTLVLPDGRDMHYWCGNVRRRHHAGRLLPEQIADLESIPRWQWRRRRPRTNRRPGAAWWLQGLDELDAWMRRTGARPPRTAVTGDGFPVGAFAARITARHAAGTLAQADAARISALPGWVWAPTYLRTAPAVPGPAATREESAPC